MSEDASPPTEDKPSAAPKTDQPAGPPSLGGLFVYMARRPLLIVAGAIFCGITMVMGVAFGRSIGEDLFNLASYVPVLGGTWAIWAGSVATKSTPRAQLPNRDHILRFVSTAFVVLALARVVGLVIPFVGTPLVRTALALSPIIALVDLRWPPSALWRCVLVVEQKPKDYLILAAASASILVLTTWAVPTVLGVQVGIASGGMFVAGLARGLGWGIIASLWTRYYLNFEDELSS